MIAGHTEHRLGFELSGGASSLGWSPGRRRRAAAESDAAAFPGKRSQWNGYERYDFQVDGKPVLVVAPKQAAAGRPWVWHGEFFGHKPAPDIALLGRGFHVVYMSVPDMLGCPEAVAHWNTFYRELTGEVRLREESGAGRAEPRRAVRLQLGGGESRQRGLHLRATPPVCDFKSWPGGKGKGKGSPRDWKLVLERYGFQVEAEALAYRKNPVDNLEPLAKAGVPLLHVYGDADDVVPWDENTGVVAERYRQAGRRHHADRQARRRRTIRTAWRTPRPSSSSSPSMRRAAPRDGKPSPRYPRRRPRNPAGLPGGSFGSWLPGDSPC